MKIYDRRSRSYIEIEQYGSGKLEFLYHNPVGRLLLWLAVSPLVSGIYGKMQGTRKSASKIAPFIEKNHIDMNDFEDREYVSFNDFFTRKIRDGKRPIDTSNDAFISPADSKLLVYEINDQTMLHVKGRDYEVSEICEGYDTDKFKGGLALVFRLCMDDYHRYCFTDSGKVIKRSKIKGKLHTVSPISKDKKIYKENTRNISLLETDNFGTMIFVEVGALLVGKIIDHGADVFEKGQEKGYFEPGGSTVIIFVERDILKVDEDIMEQSRNGVETCVRYGERIGGKNA